MFYQGSRLFIGLCSHLSFSLDQINFLAGQLFAFLVGLFFRSFLKPGPANTFKRHIVSFLIGIFLAYFCYGFQIVHLFIQSSIVYLSILFLPRNYVHIFVIIFSLAYLSSLHIYRLIYDYANYTIEITGALMIATQKLTSLAFFYHDGLKTNQELTQEQIKNKIVSRPSLVEFLSYMYNFQGVLIGPLVFYQEYIEFITGESILKHQNKADLKEYNFSFKNDNLIANGFDKNYQLDVNANIVKKSYIEQPDNNNILFKKILILIFIGFIYKKVTIVYPVKGNLDLEVLTKPIWYRFLFHYISVTSQRFKYYLAWQISDIVSNASGLGFNGYDENNQPKWDLCTSVNIFEIETSTSVKYFIDNWNMTTQKWLRRIAYERMPTGKTLGVFVLSALWHGFYPGYYLTFVLAAFLVYAGRGIRHNIRLFFLKNKLTFDIYSVITWLGTITAVNYAATSFVLLEFKSSIQFYNSWYWIVHIIALTCVVSLPYRKNKTKNQNTKQCVQ